MICLAAPVFGQQPLHFDHLTTQQGLAHNQLFSICQDREGFMWFGTADGLSRYDGYSFTNFKPDPGDPANHMGHNMVWDILETHAGELWFATPGEGIHRVNKQTGQINFFRLDPTRLALRNICYTLTEDHQGFLWIGSEGGLNRFDPRTKQFKLYETPGANKRIWSVLEDQSGTLWVGTSDGLFTLNRHTGTFTPYALDPTHASDTHPIETIYQGASSTVWVASKGNALYQLAPVETKSAGHSEPRYRAVRQMSLAAVEIFPNGLAEDADKTLLIGTTGGLLRLNPRTGEAITYRADPSVANSLSHDLVWAVLRDRRGTLWVGTTGGVDRVSTLVPKFALYQVVADRTANARLENSITNLFVDKQGIIWFSTEMNRNHQGLFRLDRRSGQPEKPLAVYRMPTNFYTNKITAIYGDRTDQLWVATPEGLHAMNQTTGQFKTYPTSFVVHHIEEDKFGNLWLGGQGTVARFTPETGRYTYFYPDPNDPQGLRGITVNDVLISRSGAVWVAVGGAGVSKLNPNTGQYTRFYPRYTAQEKILFRRDVLALYETNDGAIWVTTNIGGMFRIDPRTEAITTFTTHNGLPDNHVVSLLGDNAGILWLTTNKGLCRFNPITKTIRVFDEKDGLQSEQFSKARGRGPHGELIFGCSNGLQVFQPAQLRNNPYVPPVYITKAVVLDSVRPFPQGDLALSHRENRITFDFVGLNYVTSEKNQYAYQLVGVNQDWVYCGSQRTVTYSSLAPGEYIFRVKAANNDGIWNEKGTALRLSIAPPWWRTWWAYGLYVLLALLGIWALIEYRSRNLLREKRVLEHKVSMRTQEVMHQKQEIEVQRNHLADALTELKETQTQLIQREKLASLGELTAGIAHEIQNPLNFVNNFSELSAELIKEIEEERERGTGRDEELEAEILGSLKANLQKISSHGNRAANIVHGMLEHAKTSTGKRQPINLNALADEYLRLAYHGQRAKIQNFNCKLVTHFDPTIEMIDVVGQDISRVLLNVFNNAFYAVYQRQLGAGSHYQPTVTVATQHANGAVEIRVGDNGMGIPESVKPKIFQPFFTTKPTGQGTGLGLSLSYDIITKGHGGTLTFSSQAGEGTEFVMRIPFARSHK